MALLSKAGSFTRAGAAGNQAITGIGFQPKLVFLFESSGSESAGGSGARFTIGAATGASNVFTTSTRSRDAVGTSDTAHIQVSDKIWTEVDISTLTATNSATFVSMDSDGFTVSWSGAFGGTVEYFALGGDSLEALVSYFDMNGSTGNQSVTGVGFQPKAVLFFNCIENTTEGPADNTQMMIGCGVSSTERWSMSFWDDDGAGTMISSDRITASKCIARYNDSAAVVEADLVSLDSDGFTINITTALACRMQFIALGGAINVKAGITQQPSAAGDVSESGFGFQPSCAIFAGVGASSLDTITAAPRPNWGVVDSSLAEIQMALSIRDNHTTSAVRKVVTQGNAISKIAIASTTIEAQAQMQSFDSDGMTLNWSAANATQSRHGFLALALGVNIFSHTGSGGASSGGAASVARALIGAVSGGAQSGGAASLSASLIAAVSGGIQTGGAATTLYSRLFSMVASGGAQSGGSATLKQVFSWLTSGGAQTGGAASVLRTFALSMLGGATLSGAANVVRTFAQSMIGGVSVAGAALLNLVQSFIGSGLIQTGGEATTSMGGSNSHVASGGAQTGGSGLVKQVLLPVVSGGITLAGAALLATVRAILPVGGALMSGEASVKRTIGVIPSGGITTGGDALVATVHVIDAVGGISTSGQALERIVREFQASGGLVTDGQADVQVTYLFSFTPDGGISTGGAALFEFEPWVTEIDFGFDGPFVYSRFEGTVQLIAGLDGEIGVGGAFSVGLTFAFGPKPKHNGDISLVGRFDGKVN
jgi:hypothetical protein